MSNAQINVHHDIQLFASMDRTDNPVIVQSSYGRGRAMSLVTVRMTAYLADDGTLSTITVKGRGFYLKSDGTVGKQACSLGYGNAKEFPEDVRSALLNALKVEAARIKVDES